MKIEKNNFVQPKRSVYFIPYLIIFSHLYFILHSILYFAVLFYSNIYFMYVIPLLFWARIHTKDARRKR